MCIGSLYAQQHEQAGANGTNSNTLNYDCSLLNALDKYAHNDSVSLYRYCRWWQNKYWIELFFGGSRQKIVCNCLLRFGGCRQSAEDRV